MSELDSWAARHAPDVLARAEKEALELAQRVLRDRLVDALVAAAERPGAPSEPGGGGRELVWVYGIVPAAPDRLAETPGVDELPVAAVRAGRLTALVSRVPAARYERDVLAERLDDLPQLEALARAHDGVLEAALDGDAVLPFRMCTLYESEDSLRSMLEENAHELLETLERVRDRAEWGVKAFLDLGAVRPDEGSQPSSGTDYLTRRRESRDVLEATRTAAETAVSEVHARLGERASAAVLGRPQDRKLTGRDDEMILNGAYLVPNEGVPEFLAVAEELRKRHAADGLTLEVTGPWPAYHFVGGQPE